MLKSKSKPSSDSPPENTTSSRKLISTEGKNVLPPPTPTNAVPNFLVKLLEACAKHKRRHEREANAVDHNATGSCDGEGSGKLPVWCHEELKSFARILPRIEATVAVRNTSCDEYQCSVRGESSSMTINIGGNVSSMTSLEPMKEEDSVGHLCALYRAIARGAFCSNAFHYLFVGDGSSNPGTESGGGTGEEQEFIHATDCDMAKGILSRITTLLQYTASDPVRMALLPLPPGPKEQGMHNDKEEIKMLHQQEDIGSTIAALLNLLQDEQLLLCAVHDLVNLSNDLSSIGESNALFNPPISANEEDGDDSTQRTSGGKIRVHVFTEIARHLPNKLNERLMVGIPSRRSLLAIQLGVWTALHRLIPKEIDGDVTTRNPIKPSNAYSPCRKISLMKSLLSASRSTSLVLPPPSHRLFDWTYSSADVAIHCLLILRTKLAIVGLFTDIIEDGSVFFNSRSFIHDGLALAPSIDVALTAVDAAKYHLLWDQVDCSESSLLDGLDASGATSHLSSLNYMCSWAISNYFALAVLFPHATSTSTNDLWSYCFPSLVDCIPLLNNPSNTCHPSNTCLRVVVVRAIHAILSASVELFLTPATQHRSHDIASSVLECPEQPCTLNAPSFVGHLRHRCVVRGYFSCLFELVQDSSESIAGPAIAIVALLLESSPGFLTTNDLIETACSGALGAITPLGREDTELPINAYKGSPMVRLGSKRRKLTSCKDGKEVCLTSSIESAFAYAISGALSDARDIMKTCTEGSKHQVSTSGGNELVTLVSESGLSMLRSVAGVLRILMSLQCGAPNNHETCLSFAKKANTRLFEAVEFISMNIVRQGINGKLARVEPKLLYDAVSLIVSIGLHACREDMSPIISLSARDAMTSCALSTLPLVQSCRPGVFRDERPGMKTSVNNSTLCRGICCSIALMFGAIAVPYSEVCLCGLVCKSNDRLAKFWGSIVVDSTLPLQCRCVLLAVLYPVAADASQYGSTQTSIESILSESARSHDSVIIRAAILCLPNLFISLSKRKDGNMAAAAKYLISMIDSFNIEGSLLPFTMSEIEGIKVSALLSLSRLVKMYVAASILAADSGVPRIDRINASSYLWQELDPKTKGMHCVLNSLWSFDEYTFTAYQDSDFHPTLARPLVSKEYFSVSSLLQDGSPRVWMATLLYLRHCLSVVSESTLRLSNTLEFFSDNRHYGIYEKLAKKMIGHSRGGEVESLQVPSPVWLFLLSFLPSDKSTQLRATDMFCQILLCNGCEVFSAFFLPKRKMRSDRNTVHVAVDKLFLEIDFILGLCGLNTEVLISEPDCIPHHNVKNLCDAELVLCVFPSLIRWAPLSTALGEIILERSLLALVRIWIASAGGFAFDKEATLGTLSCNSLLANSAFDHINEIFKCTKSHPKCSHSIFLLKQVNIILPKILVEFFLPQHDIAALIRYRLLSMFIGSFLIASPIIKSLRAQNSFEVSNAFEIIEFIDGAYLPTIVQMIKDEDHEAIQMCAAFRMFLLGEAKKMNKEEKRVQKKNLAEFSIGSRHEKNPLSRSLVPGVSISTSKLIENAKLLCIKTDVISHVLPQLLLHPGQAPLRFFTTKVCQSELDYPDILRGIGLPVLKTLVWELGKDDPDEDSDEEMYDGSCFDNNCPRRKDVRLALTKGFLLKEGNTSSKLQQLLMSPTQDNGVDGELCTSPAGRWVAPNMMFLLVNIVLHQWPKRTEREKFQVVKCLRAMLHFLSPSDSPQYMPQIMAAINNALSSTVFHGTANRQCSNLRYIAVATLFDFLKLVVSHDASQVGGHLIIIVVALLPLFDSEVPGCENDMARKHAVKMLEWLASGEVDGDLPQYFNEIPFLPFTQDLADFRSILVEKGIHLDDMHIMSQQVGPKIGTSDHALLESRFYNRMNILSQLLLSQENQNVRKVVITHLTDLIKANRDSFRNLVVNEELSSMNFLTVVHDTPSKADCSGDTNAIPDSRINGGFITKLLIRLLSRCLDETDCEIRDAIASCLGEIGAIDPNRLSKAINFSQFVANSGESDKSCEWRLMNPPWKTQIAVYQLRLMTRHLVSGLKSAPTTLDQHKISFAIQELLKIMNLQLGGTNEMSPLLKNKLQEAGVCNIVEPFWTTNYKQVDTTAPKAPPFFTKSHTYFSWLSSFSRYLVSRSNANKKSVWGDFFHACRSAIRSQAGVGVSEFLLPLLVLDSLCFGGTTDEDLIVDEFLYVLTSGGGSLMGLRDREKVTNVVFTIMDVLRHWLEKEIELRSHQSKGRSKRINIPSADNVESWPAAESIRKIERMLNRIPYASCAQAASEVGMRARALQYLEMEGRKRAGPKDNSLNGDLEGASKFVSSSFIEGVDLKLAQVLLGQLNDFDTMLFVGQKNHHLDLTKRLADEAAEREMYEDWEGSYQAYEQLLDSRLTIENESLVEKGMLRCLLKLGRVDSALNQAFGMSKLKPGLGNLKIRGDLLPSAVEAAWRLGNWQVLDNLISNLKDELPYDAEERYQLSFGRAMHSLRSKSNAGVAACLKDSREFIISSLSSAARDGYTRSYPYLVQLHALREIECLSSYFFDDQRSSRESFVEIMSSKEWRERLDLSTSDTTGSNAIMINRLAVSRMVNEPTIEASLWLDVGKMARKAGLHRVAQHSLTQANVAFCKSLTVDDKARECIGIVKLQIAKLKYAVGESTMAMKLIEDEIPNSVLSLDEKQLKAFVSSDSIESREIIARRILQSTEWMASDGLRSSSEIKDRYLAVLKLAPNWERAHFTYAKFLDSLFESRISTFKGRSASAVIEFQELRAEAIRSVQECQECLINSIEHYGMALQLGQKHVYQALPRLLAMWLEFTALEGNDDAGQCDPISTTQSMLNDVIKSLATKIPEHLFYTALPQLISRVVHQNSETSNNVALIIRNVLVKYPRQSLWSCGWLRFSKAKEKKKAGDEIFFGAQVALRKAERDAAVQNLLGASKSLFQFFISLARFNPKPNHTAVKMKVPTFETELTNFIPPIQAALSLSPGALEGSTGIDVFPSFAPRMRAFNPELKIMQSKAKPKKVSIFAVPSAVARRQPLPVADHSIAQDVGEIHFLVKQEAKGDLRKDSRVQDLNNVINRIFAGRKGSSGPNSHRRKLRLQLRTFSVVCLAEDCGILEWVPSTESLRSVISETYNPQVAPESVHRRGSRITNFADLELKDTFSRCQDLFFKKGNLEMATKKFDELILQQYLPVLYWWFVQNFSSPHAWYEARSNFTLSTALWSAIGHIIGLGDRHSENILIDTSSGECVHVDFDCIFDKGLDLPRPEVIPFRLTPNMLDAFGPTGADGMFTGALIESMRTLRKNRDTLLSVLEPFLNDPVINFKSKSQKNSKENKKEDFISNIEGRLDGEYNLINTNLQKFGRNKDGPCISETDHITTLSVEGQVQKMIMEATSKQNLVQVYVGWMPWI